MATTTAAAPFVRCLLPRLPGASHAADDATTGGGGSRKRSRLVLLQHTADLTTRLTAAGDAGTTPRPAKGARGNNPTSSSSTATTEDALYRLAGLRTPSEAAARDLAGGGPALVLAALEEVASRTGGRVVWVSAADHLRLPIGGGDEDDSNGWAAQFRRHGATVDLASDPLGWDASDDDDDDDGEKKKREEGSGGACAHRCFSSQMDSLGAVLSTIQRAAASIASADDGEEATAGAAAGEVPVIFDSIVPLLSFHGPAKTLRFLRRLLGRGLSSNTRASSSGGDDNNTCRRYRQTIVTSPLVVPMLVESIRPPDMRRFEDEADSIVTLSGGEMRTMRRGGGDGKVGGAAGRLGTDIQQFALEQQTERVVLLNPSEQNDRERKKRVVAQRRTKGMTESSADKSLLQPATDKLASMEIAGPSPLLVPPQGGSSTSQRARPTLQIGEEGRDAATDASAATKERAGDSAAQNQPTTKSGPRIFVQDDDPEFDDIDEEDMDDDLDL